MSIKANTIDRYLYAAEKLCIAAHQMDYRLDVYGKKSEYIKKVLREQKYKKNMLNRCEQVTGKMIEEMQEVYKDLDSDSIECTFPNWNILGRYLGFCLKENRKSFPLLAIDNITLVFTFKDF